MSAKKSTAPKKVTSAKVKKDALLKAVKKTTKKSSTSNKAKVTKAVKVKKDALSKTPAKKVATAKKVKAKEIITKEKAKKVTAVKPKKKETSKKEVTSSKKTEKEIKVTKPTKIKKVKIPKSELVNDDELKTRINIPVIKDVEEVKRNYNKLKEYDIGKVKKEPRKKIITKEKLKLILSYICKILLAIWAVIVLITKYIYKYACIGAKYIVIGTKKIFIGIKKLFTLLHEKYIIYKENKNNKKQNQNKIKVKEDKKENNTTVPIKDEKIKNSVIIEKNNKKKKLTKAEKKAILNADDNPNLLRYRDYHGIAWLAVFVINRVRVIIFDMKRFNKKFKYGTLKDKILILLMLILIAGFSCMIVFCVYIVVSAPEISDKRLYKSNSTTLLDVNGNIYAKLGTENREKVTYDELPEVLVDAIVSAEDSRFFQHNGIDLARFTKAVIGQLAGNPNAGGGSTLTMQVSKNAATTTTSTGIKGLIRKFTDIYLSVFVFEKKYTKQEILEFYVNIPFLGSGSYGVQQASKTYFGKSVSELSLVEAATIAGLFQAPSSYDPFAHPQAAENRRNTILNLMYKHGYITEEERDAAKAIPLKSTLAEKSSTTNKYQDFVDTVIDEVIERTGEDPTETSMKIYTTMNPEKQDVVNGIISGETYTWKNDYAQAGIAVISVADGSLVAVGASRDTAQRVYNHATEARRHPGSTAKPVIDYGPAIEYLNWSTGQTVIDNKMTYSSGGQIKNFDNGYKGIMTAKTALAQSRNIPALYTFQQTTNEQKLEFATNLGWRPETDIKNENLKADTPQDIKGTLLESDSIGGFEGVTPLESAAAYATFARGGTYIEPYSFTKIEYSDTNDVYEVKPKKIQAMSDSTAYMISMILKYAVTSGSVGAGSVSGTDICAKTGTSTVDAAAKKSAGITGGVIGDSWEVAYSPDYAISTWYGYDTLNKDHYLTSSEGGTARKTITKMLTAGIMEKNSRFKQPDSVTQAEIELGTDPLELASPYTPSELRATEYFKKGTVPDTVSSRFNTLSNASDLKYSSTATSVTLAWKAASTPDAINTEYLRNYFENNVYKNWSEQYLQERINYNNSVFGSFGYEVYMTNASGTVDLGFTTSTSFTANVQFDETTSFTVKSSYQNFKSNQSSGISVSVKANSSTIDTGTTNTTTQAATWSVEYIGTIPATLDSYNKLGSSPANKLKVTSNGTDVTSKANISAYCYNSAGDEISCNTMTSGNTYTVKFVVRYNGQTRNKQISITS